MLTNLGGGATGRLQCFLVGQPQLRRLLARPELEQLRQRVVASCHLEPLAEEETGRYVRHRLEVAGWQRQAGAGRGDRRRRARGHRRGAAPDQPPVRAAPAPGCGRRAASGWTRPTSRRCWPICGPRGSPEPPRPSDDAAARARQRRRRAAGRARGAGARDPGPDGGAGAARGARMTRPTPGPQRRPHQRHVGRRGGLSPRLGAVARRSARERWDAWPSRVAASTHRVLELLAAAEVRATFFVLGWVARRHPGLCARSWPAGTSSRATATIITRSAELSPDAFRRDVAGHPPPARGSGRGGGARLPGAQLLDRPSTSGGRSRCWARPATATAPACTRSRTTITACPTAPRFPFRPGGRQPAGDPGGHARSGPPRLLRRRRAFPPPALRLVALVPRPATPGPAGRPATFYFHPWEIDPGQPRVTGPPLALAVPPLRQSRPDGGQAARLLRDFAWGRIDRVHDSDPTRHPTWRPAARDPDPRRAGRGASPWLRPWAAWPLAVLATAGRVLAELGVDGRHLVAHHHLPSRLPDRADRPAAGLAAAARLAGLGRARSRWRSARSPPAPACGCWARPARCSCSSTSPWSPCWWPSTVALLGREVARRAAVPAPVPVLHGAVRRGAGARSAGLHRPLRGGAAAAGRRAGVPRRHPDRDAQRPVRGRRGLRRHPLPDRQPGGRHPVRPPRPPAAPGSGSCSWRLA